MCQSIPLCNRQLDQLVNSFSTLACCDNIIWFQVWKSILEHTTSDEIGVAIAPLFQSMAWVWLLVVPISSPIEVNLLVPPSPGAAVGIYVLNLQLKYWLFYRTVTHS